MGKENKVCLSAREILESGSDRLPLAILWDAIHCEDISVDILNQFICAILELSLKSVENPPQEAVESVRIKREWTKGLVSDKAVEAEVFKAYCLATEHQYTAKEKQLFTTVSYMDVSDPCYEAWRIVVCSPVDDKSEFARVLLALIKGEEQ